ncbi:MAG TPA: GNAT family N-acetyltransferase [Thermoplasmata archaeon]|nr:GNAT family N-acetyltransferase [Thermoplasmata archaeon]
MAVRPHSGIIIRRLRKGEWREARRLRLSALRTDPLAFSSLYEEELGFPDSRWQERVARGAESHEASTWVAEDPSGELVGSVAIILVEGVLNVVGMWLDPGQRGKGLGGQLLDAALAWAHSNHPRTKVRLDVNAGQSAAVALYESRGFQFHGVRQIPKLPGRSGLEIREMVLDRPFDSARPANPRRN